MIIDENKVSVIIPTYGGSGSLTRAIDSVIDQSYSSFEVIVVDDNNPGTEGREKTEKCMLKYVDNPIVKYIKHDKNRNGSAARNTGFRASTGGFICLLDDDDVFLSGKIAKQVSYLLSNPEYGACYCWRRQRGKEICGCYTGDLSQQLLDLTFTPTTSALMIRRSCYEALDGFDESYRRHQDYEFMLRFFKHFKMGVVEEVLLDFVGNEVNNQLKGKKLYDTKVQFFSQFDEDIKQIEVANRGFKRKVYSAHFSDAIKELIRYGNIGLAFKMYCKYGIKGGTLFWKYFFRKINDWIGRNIGKENVKNGINVEKTTYEQIKK